MKHVVQNVRDGKLSVETGIPPAAQPNEILIANSRSVISAGTEKMVMDLASKSLLSKARERPDHVRRVLEKIRHEGLFKTIAAVQEKLDEPLPMGYSSAGVVLACGPGVEQFKPGDRVASNGAHAEIVSVPRNLCAKVPDNVPFDHAAFAVLGAIALQGVRLAKAHFGETVLVIGLGLVGQLTVSLLASSGCRVIGTDPDPSRCDLATKMGASHTIPDVSSDTVLSLTDALGADAVLITASSKSKGPMDLAASAVRKRGRVVLVGVVNLELDRRPFYFKEAEFVVSCSYGPGRYDPLYEEVGLDYPAAYVRWTEQRNIASVLQAMSEGRLNVEPLISHRFPIEQAETAYKMIREGSEPFLAVLLQYDISAVRLRTIELPATAGRPVAVDRNGSARVGIGVLGAGNFARMVLIPAIARNRSLARKIVCSAGGASAVRIGQKYAFERATSDENEVFESPDVSAVFSITQHNLHAAHVVRAVRTGKHLFVEKPLCTTIQELSEIERAIAESPGPLPLIMVGFNRRFAPLAATLKQCFARIAAPLTISFRFNAGSIPPDHWTQRDDAGGGRIVGEACHAIDFVSWLCGSLPVRVFAESIGGPFAPSITDDQSFLTMRHANGSVSNIAFLAGGDRACPKERIEVMGGGVTAILDDFKTLTIYDRARRRVYKGRHDKGHEAEVDAFVAAVSAGGPCPVSWPEIYATTLTSLLAVQSLREGMPMQLPELRVS